MSIYAVIAIVALYFIAMKLLQMWLDRQPTPETDPRTEMRRVLKDDMDILRVEVEEVEKEVKTWRDKYYSLYEQLLHTKLRLVEIRGGGSRPHPHPTPQGVGESKKKTETEEK